MRHHTPLGFVIPDDSMPNLQRLAQRPETPPKDRGSPEPGMVVTLGRRRLILLGCLQ